MEQDKKIGFNDLTQPLKVFVILGWIVEGVWVLSFIAGLVIGIMGLY